MADRSTSSRRLARRACEVVATAQTGGYRIFSALDAERARAGGGPVLHARRASRVGRGGGPAVPAARVLGRRAPSRRRAGVRLDFLVEAVGPGHRAPGGARAGRAAARHRAARAPVLEPAELAPDAAGAILVGGGIGIAPLALLRRALVARGVPERVAARLPRSRALRRHRALRLLGDPARQRGRTRRPPGLRDRPARGAARGRRCRQRGRLRVRAAGDARGGSGDLRRARASPAELAMEAPMACGFGACFGCAVPLATAATCGCASTARSSTRRRDRDGARRGVAGTDERRTRSRSAASRLEHPMLNGSGTFDAIAARRAFGDEVPSGSRSAPSSRRRSRPEPRAGNPPPRLYETPAGMINSIGLPNKGLEGFLEPRPARARRACRCR